MALLVVDIGNTNIVIGIYKENNLLQSWRIQTHTRYTEDELAILLKNFLTDYNIYLSDISGCIISSVVPNLNHIFERLGKKYLSIKINFVHKMHLPNQHFITKQAKETIGSDLIANAVAAKGIYGGPAIIIDLGTATTFTMIELTGNYLGTVIAPGIHISAQALFKQAARLTNVNIIKPQNILGNTTEESLQSGIYYSALGTFEGIIKRLQETLSTPAKVIITGGLSKIFEHEEKLFDIVDYDLTVKGLKIIYDRYYK